jgi:hypothetical protein
MKGAAIWISKSNGSSLRSQQGLLLKRAGFFVDLSNMEKRVVRRLSLNLNGLYCLVSFLPGLIGALCTGQDNPHAPASGDFRFAK